MLSSSDIIEVRGLGIEVRGSRITWTRQRITEIGLIDMSLGVILSLHYLIMTLDFYMQREGAIYRGILATEMFELHSLLDQMQTQKVGRNFVLEDCSSNF